MGWIVEINAKNPVWENIKTWGPPVFTLLLGLSIGALMNWRRHRKEVRNIRSMIAGELSWILETAQNSANDDDAMLTPMLEHLTETPVYNAYLARLGTLSDDELHSLQHLHSQLRIAHNETLRIRNGGIMKDAHLPLYEIIERTTSAIEVVEHYQQPWYRRVFRKKENQIDQS